MTLLSAFATYAVKFIALLGVAVGGYLLGSRCRRSKNQKKL